MKNINIKKDLDIKVNEFDSDLCLRLNEGEFFATLSDLSNKNVF